MDTRISDFSDVYSKKELGFDVTKRKTSGFTENVNTSENFETENCLFFVNVD